MAVEGLPEGAMRVRVPSIGLVIAMAGGLPAAADPTADYQKSIVPLLENYCYDCHGDGASKGSFSLDEFDDLSKHLQDKKLWLHVWQNVRGEIMPPSDKDQPTLAERKQLLKKLRQLRLIQFNGEDSEATVETLLRVRPTIAQFVSESALAQLLESGTAGESPDDESRPEVRITPSSEDHSLFSES